MAPHLVEFNEKLKHGQPHLVVAHTRLRHVLKASGFLRSRLRHHRRNNLSRPRRPYRLVFKQQTYDPLTFQERVATGPTLEGPWSNISGPINETWSEGPSAIQVGNQYIVFYDHYRAPRARYEAVATTDWKHWRDITSQISMPAFCKHGSFLHITDKEATRLLARHDSLASAAPSETNPHTP